jgi:hypothetical protein
MKDLYKKQINEKDKQIEKQIKQLEEQNKQISKAKEDFEHQVIVEKYEKENLEKQHSQLSEKYKRLELIESNNSIGYIKQTNDLKKN